MHYVPVTSGNNAFAAGLIVVHLAVATPLICHRLVEGADDNMSHSNQRPFALLSLPDAMKEYVCHGKLFQKKEISFDKVEVLYEIKPF